MTVNILRSGSRGEDVERWELFLIGQGLLRVEVDGLFDDSTANATKAFQRTHGLSADGIVGPKTFGAALSNGFNIGFTDLQRDDAEPIVPERPKLQALRSAAERQALFGPLEFEPAGTTSNPEAVRITNDWESGNLVSVIVPQLKGKNVFGKPSKGRMQFHKRALPQLLALWDAWGRAALLDRILTYDGSFNARFVRGSRVELSNHAFGTAFDINAEWNPLGAIPPLVGSKGSVRELVDIANEHGFFWGGHFERRPDGMHFEVAEIRDV
jgi:hypothetical protein